MTVQDIRTIGIIGAGNIGGQLARLGVQHGYQVVIANSRGPETLHDLVAGIGDGASAATAEDAAREGDVVVVTIPLKNIGAVPVTPLAGKVVIDTNNYYPERDGQIEVLDDETTTTAQLLQDHLPESKVVKAFNHIMAAQLTTAGTPEGTSGRRALAVFGDDSAAKVTVQALIDDLGFDTLDGGDLAESWRIQRDTPGYVKEDDVDQLADHLAEAKRYRDM